MKKNSLMIILLAVFLAPVSGCGHSSKKEGNSGYKVQATANETAKKEVKEKSEGTDMENEASEKEEMEAGSKETGIRQNQKSEEVKSESSASVQKASQQEKKAELKVTFVELGSVKCIPCKMMQPIMEEIEKEYAGQVKVVFHDVWTPEGQPYAKQYGIRGIPTQVFLDKDGKEYYRHVGYFPKEELVKILKMQGVE